MIATAGHYTFKQEELIKKSIAKSIQDLQYLVHDKKSVLSARQLDTAKRELKQYQELQYQNRLNRLINMKWR
ncbi:hypothetical protein GUI51_02055 [Enterococcus mundtii]|nr:hypothetical protein EM4838_04005 [Enterococcus mundtii]MZZ57659.1 hypothetical protein [Enterococcus mundtii]MZZ60634.1 hypothetical protein [Enterococcus mundtii]MZZ67619.1 hypothetical protein [Enterococcus mundtii]MZZ96470.1 hypothetical protein [Enterococcus mundtii]